MQVFRQREEDLIKAVHELCDGDPSNETLALMCSLDRPLPEDNDVTRLYGTNFDVNYVNHDMLDDMEGEYFTFRATDKGKYLLYNSFNRGKLSKF